MNRSRDRLVLVLGLMLVASSCGDDSRSPAEPAKDAPGAPAMTAPMARISSEVAADQVSGSQAADPGVKLPSQMIIRTGQVSIEVDSLERAVREVTEMAAKAGGFIASSSISSGENAARTATIEVKIPAERYQGTVDGLKQVGKIRSAATNSQDVGEEFVDVTARVSNAKKLEERILNLLATRTGKIEDVLNVERELARVREEIERYEGRIRYLKSQVSMSTLTVTVFEPGPLVGDPGENVLVAAFKQSWRNFVGVVAGGIAAAGGFIPMLAFAGLVLLVLRWGWKRIRPSGPPAA